MTTFAAQPDAARRLAELDALTRGAWTAYRDDLRELEGTAYVDAEAAAWDQLQATLRQLDVERAALVAAAAAAD
ncbi:MAG: hypothetical protein QOJ85_3348 [Solirubrobacteraceae bacterium]|nr:hypothetical protein [Solirubrobacteraceae bacterium]